MAVNLFITGEKRIGKSSLLKEMIEPYRYSADGFFTQRIYMPAYNGCAFRMVELSSTESYTLEVHMQNISKEFMKSVSSTIFFCKDASGVCRKNPEVFDLTGSAILENALKSKKPLVIIDEIGRFEQSAKSYLMILEKLLDSDIRILGVLQKDAGELTARIAKRLDTKVLELNESNSFLIKAEITAFLKQIPIY